MKLDEKWVRDTGLVFALLFLFMGRTGNGYFLAGSAVSIALMLFAPKALWPLAWGWLKVAEILGFLMNRVFFGLVFFVVVVPVGLLRRIIKGDARDLEKQLQEKSAFIDNDKVLSARDLLYPF